MTTIPPSAHQPALVEAVHDEVPAELDNRPAEIDEGPAEIGEVPAEEPDPMEGTTDHWVDALAASTAAVQQLAEDSRKYHARAEHREGVIDRMHAELEQLRRGERRSMLRPLLTEVCRLRDDLLRQAAQLPDDFGPDQAASLLRSYADSMEIALADNGVVIYQPEPSEAFAPRSQRAVGKTPTEDGVLVGCVATVRKSGYRDLETDLSISAAEVTVYVPAVRTIRLPEPAVLDLDQTQDGNPDGSKSSPEWTRKGSEQ